MIKKPSFVAILLLATAALAQEIPADRFKAGEPFSRTYQPITGRQRLQWFAQSTAGPQSLAAGLFSAGFGTAINRPTVAS